MTAERPLSGPEVQIVRGVPTAEELAALTAVLAAVANAPAPVPSAPPVRGRWNDPAHAVRRAWTVGPGRLAIRPLTAAGVSR